MEIFNLTKSDNILHPLEDLDPNACYHNWKTYPMGWSPETGHKYLTECLYCGDSYEWDDESRRRREEEEDILSLLDETE